MHPSGLDHAGLFEASPNPYLVLDRRLYIVGANRAYLAATKRELSDIVGRWAWDAFPTDPDTLRQSVTSFERVIATRAPDTMALLRFDIPRPAEDGGGFEERWWSIIHSPVLDGRGEVAFVLQHPIDVTELQKLRAALGGEQAPGLAPAHTGIFERAADVHEQNLGLKAESARLRALFEQAPGFVAVLRGPKHVFGFINAAYERLVGRSDLVGRPVREALPDIAGQGFFELLDRVLATGERFVAHDVPIRLRPSPEADEAESFLDFIYEPMLDDGGRVEGIFVQGSDVTAGHRAREALRASEAALRVERELLNAVIRQAPVGISIAEAPSGRALVLNDKATELLGHAQRGEDARRYERYGAVHPDGRLYTPEDYPTLRALRRGEVVDQEDMIYRRGGPESEELTRLAVSSAPVRDEAGAIVAAVTAFIDIDEQRRVEEQLRASEARYRQIVEGAEDFAIVTLDERGTITSWNSGAERIMGFAEAEAVGWPGAIFFTPEDRAAGAPDHEMNRARSDGRAPDERWHLKKDGTRFWGSRALLCGLAWRLRLA